MAGNLDNLRRATATRTATAVTRAEKTLEEMRAAGEPVTFRGLAARSGVSLDFLYRHTGLRSRIEQLREAQTAQPSRPAEPDQPSNIVRTLTAQLSELKARHRAEITALNEALAAAHGENLLLRRRLGPNATAGTNTSPNDP
ncbi:MULTISPECIES: DUF6262 family protein [unclassified Pseudofrankia]|uniref:DUF6262 family protein n=1 Tax=unclassified Pseudofrankia TaxID=2994372 RepID=UPI0008D90B4D|nr:MULTISPECIES: DUF6262 family protein [unclassified Pseudofrankia]MDT3446266.1 DUF6262 family protein [Pseudofrankia sp. BMG5.37]OHV63079.1 hypothetical protein BCD48_38500 [Pseudofrankia sp. BMG5.36]